MLETNTSLGIGELTMIGLGIILVNAFLVVIIFRLIDGIDRKRMRRLKRNAAERAPRAASAGYSPMNGAVLSARSYKGSVPPVGIMDAMPDFGDGEQLRTVYAEYDPAAFGDANTFGGRYFNAKAPRRIEKRIPMGNAYGRKVVLGTVVPKKR